MGPALSIGSEIDTACITSPCINVMQNLFRRHTASLSFIGKLSFLIYVITLFNIILSEKKGSQKWLFVIILWHHSADVQLNHSNVERDVAFTMTKSSCHCLQ